MSTKIQMKLKKDTIDSVNNLCNITGVNNKVTIVAQAIKLYECLHTLQLQGVKIYKKMPDGSRSFLTLPELFI